MHGTIHVSSVMGHSAVVGEEFRELPEFLHKPALEAGCITDAMPVASHVAVPEQAIEPSMLDRLADVLRTMVAEGNDEDFTGNGLPDLRKVRARLGFSVDRETMLKTWHELGEE